MSTLVATMKKMKSGNIGGIQKHNQREFEHHSNKDIDPERSDQNYDLVNSERISYADKIDQIINDQRVGTRAIRKDAVRVDEWIISSDKKFFDRLSPDQTRKFFQTVVTYFQKNFGQQNVAYADVHLDESTPHMHMGIVPMIDGRLSSKRVFNRERLTQIQSDLPKFIKEKGFDLERGIEGSKTLHHSTTEYKKLKEKVTKEQLGDLSHELDQAKKRNVVYEDILSKNFNVRTIEPREMRARLVLADLERGIKPNSLQEARGWLERLKDGFNTLISPERLNWGINLIKQIIKVITRVVER